MPNERNLRFAHALAEAGAYSESPDVTVNRNAVWNAVVGAAFSPRVREAPIRGV